MEGSTLSHWVLQQLACVYCVVACVFVLWRVFMHMARKGMHPHPLFSTSRTVLISGSIPIYAFTSIAVVDPLVNTALKLEPDRIPSGALLLKD